ncbi:MAG: TIGR00730 family Rossman fold protein [Erysipelotrichaceae bacterium]|nr:TIGR00730 family Rossman fold protein [Erysipelotrichaceae bacterium]
MKICIFGASSDRIDSIYVTETEKLGFQLAQKGCTLVTGGGKRGLMGAANRGFSKADGYIISVSPRLFNVDGILYDDFNELYLTRDLVDRKQLMIEMSDAFIAVPGGTGTFDEFFEVLVQNQLGFTRKPVILYNINGYYTGLWEYLKYSCRQGFLSSDWDKVCHMASTPEEVIDILHLN